LASSKVEELKKKLFEEERARASRIEKEKGSDLNLRENYKKFLDDTVFFFWIRELLVIKRKEKNKK